MTLERFREMHSQRLGRELTKAEATELLLSTALVLDRAADIVAEAHDTPSAGLTAALYSVLRQCGASMPGTDAAAHLFELAKVVQHAGPTQTQVQSGAYVELATKLAARYDTDGVTAAEAFANQAHKTDPQGGTP